MMAPQFKRERKMKKTKGIISLVTGLILLISVIFSVTGCVTPGLEEAVLDYIDYILGFYSYPTIYITDGGSNFSNPYDPVTGTNITNATVTVSNETTGVSTTAAYVAASPRGYYKPTANFSHNPGERVSLTVITTNETITGSPTVTPDPVYSSLSPTSGATATLPFTISWDVTQGTYEASHTWVWINDASGSSAEAKNYQEIVPISTKSLQITSAEVQAGIYTIGVFGVNTMTISRAKSGSIVYVDGGGTRAYSSNVMVQ